MAYLSHRAEQLQGAQVVGQKANAAKQQYQATLQSQQAAQQQQGRRKLLN